MSQKTERQDRFMPPFPQTLPPENFAQTPDALKTARKLVVISSDVFVRNYIHTGAFEAIADENFYIAATSDVTLLDDLDKLPGFLGVVQYDAKDARRHDNLINLYTLAYQDRSPTFKFRFGWQAYEALEKFKDAELEKGRPYRFFKTFLSRQVALSLAWGCRFIAYTKGRKFITTPWLARPGLIPFFKQRFEQQTPPNRQLEKIIEELKPDLILYPTTAAELPGYDLGRLRQGELAKRHPFRLVFLIDNWDNLSSKSVFPYPPDEMTVWGQQSIEHAQSIHDIPPERVYRIGTPRYEEYFETAEKMARGEAPPESPYPFPYILYTGGSLPFDELTGLKHLEILLRDYNIEYPDKPLKLIYRPHPWRLRRLVSDKFDPKEFWHIQLDDQLKEHYFNPQTKGRFSPALDYYPRLLANAEFVTGPLTSMLIEGALFNKKVLAIAYDDGIHYTHAANSLKFCKHFEGITEIPGWFFAHHLSDLESSFLETLNTPNSAIDWVKQKEKIGYYIYHDDQPYAQRLKNILAEIITKK